MLGKTLLSLLAISAINAVLAAKLDVEKRDTLEIKLSSQPSSEVALASDDYTEKCAWGRCTGQPWPHHPPTHGGRGRGGRATEEEETTSDTDEFIEQANCVKKGARTCCDIGKWGWRCYLTEAETAVDIDVSDLEVVENGRPACYKRLDRICCPDASGKYVCRKFGPGVSVSTMGPCWNMDGNWCCQGFRNSIACSHGPSQTVSEALESVMDSSADLDTVRITECWSASSGRWCCKSTKGRVGCSAPCRSDRCGLDEVLAPFTVAQDKPSIDEIPSSCWNQGRQWCCKYSKGRTECSSPCPGGHCRFGEALAPVTVAQDKPSIDEIPSSCWNQGRQWCCKYSKGRTECSSPCPGGHCRFGEVLAPVTVAQDKPSIDEIPSSCWNQGRQWCCKYSKGRTECSSPCPGGRCWI